MAIQETAVCHEGDPRKLSADSERTVAAGVAGAEWRLDSIREVCSFPPPLPPPLMRRGTHVRLRFGLR